MEDQRLEFRISGELLAQVDRARGELPRAAWVKDAIRKSLEVAESPGAVKAREVAAETAVPSSSPPPRVVPSVAQTWARPTR